MNGEWLSDKHINAAGSLLKKHFAEPHGLQDTLLLQEKLAWNGESTKFVQVVNISRNHWVCVSNVQCQTNTVNVFDSLPHFSMKSTDLSCQVATILKSPSTAINLNFINTQRQIGGSDCGLFAIAYATSICFGIDPSLCSYDQSKIRHHLTTCFQNGTITLFPPSTKPMRTKLSKVTGTTSIRIYCICRLPWVKHGSLSCDLVQCDKCHEWFHDKCENIPTVSKNSKEPWYCSTCLLLITVY